MQFCATHPPRVLGSRWCLPIHFFRFGHFCGVRVHAVVSFLFPATFPILCRTISKNICCLVTSTLEIARDILAGRCLEDFSSASPPMSIEIFERPLHPVSRFSTTRKPRPFFHLETTAPPLSDRRISKGEATISRSRNRPKRDEKRVRV